MEKNLTWLKKIYIAHRGIHDISKSVPENSILAFEKAIKRNIAIELDVHLLNDNTIVVFHDYNLIRMCNINKIIEDCSYQDIKSLKLSNTNYYIPTLIEILDLIKGKVPIIIEIKSEKNTKKCCQVLYNILKDYKGIFAVKSFNPFAIYYFKKHYPEIARGLLASDFKNNKSISKIKKIIVSNLLLLPICKPDFLSLNYNMLNSKKSLSITKKINLPILAWTFKTKDEVSRYESFCDSYICEEKDEIYIK